LTNARGSSAHLVPLKITNEVVTLRYRLWSIHRVSKNKQTSTKSDIFGTKMANSLKLYKVHPFSTSTNLCQCTTMLNANVPNCYITL